jgi:transposase
MNENMIGIDVAKCNLDLHFFPSGESGRIPNNQHGYEELVARISGNTAVKILVESTACYHIPLQNFLAGRGYAVYVLNPKLVRDYAKSCGKLAKTDAIDAAMIAKYGATHELRAPSDGSEALRRFKLLINRRRQLIRMQSTEKIHGKQYEILGDGQLLQATKEHIAFCDAQLAVLDKEIDSLLASTPNLKERYDIMVGIRGVGKATAYELIAEMPELGTIGKREVTALAGLAPMNRDSGARRGQRHIGGGRVRVRNALFMACLSAIQHNPVIATYYKRLREEGCKPFKVAIIACMHKLLLHINSICRRK